jgi:hypothetical protein
VSTTSDASTVASSTSASTVGASTDAAQALGDFLHTLMEAMHGQSGQGGAAPAQGERPPAGGGMEADLQSLIASVSADGADAASGSATATLQASFASLLGSLGLEQSGASGKLGEFLQTLASKLEAGGSSGNLIDTSA